MVPVASAITRVLVTGFGPFQGVPDNPSWAIASRLPTTLGSDIALIVHPSYVPVAYHPTIKLVPQLIATYQPDIVLHMGVAAGRSYFAVEQTSQNSGYQWAPDIDGQVFTVAEQEEAWAGQPAILSTDINLSAVVNEWQNQTSNIKWPFDLNSNSARKSSGNVSLAPEPGSPLRVKLIDSVFPTIEDQDLFRSEDVRWSDAIGSYLCGFIYYADLVEMGQNGKRKTRDVAFMHVPSLNTEEQVQMGVNVTLGLVEALVKTWRSQRGV